MTKTCSAGHFLLLTETTAYHLTLGHYMFLRFKSLKVYSYSLMMQSLWYE